MISGSSATSRSTGISQFVALPVDRLATGELDHLGIHRVVGDAVDRGLVAGLDEHPRPLDARGRRGDLVECAAHVRDQGGPSAGRPTAAAVRSISASAPSTSCVDHEHGNAERAKSFDGIGWRAAGATCEDEVGAGVNDLLDVDAVEAAHHRHVGRLGRVVGDVLDLADDAVAGAEREQDLGLGRGEGHDPLRFGGERDGRPLVVGQSQREGHRGQARRGDEAGSDGAASDGAAAEGARPATGDEAAPDEQATATSATTGATLARRARGWGEVGTMRLQGNERKQVPRRRPPRAGQREGRVSRSVASLLPLSHEG